MGTYLSPGNTAFKKSLNSDIYVDKSLLIEFTNHIINKKNQYICVSRPRRFGKSTDAQMLAAYYDDSCDSAQLFHNLKISTTETYAYHLNKYKVILIDVQKFLSQTHTITEMIQLMNDLLIWELLKEYKDIDYFDKTKLTIVLDNIYNEKNVSFIFIVDEWDCIFREFKNDVDAQKKYLDFLRLLFKEQSYISLVYMTGILPIKKYGSHSALNMFEEYSMIDPYPLTSFMGFTSDEVKQLCNLYHMDFEEMKNWYNGYYLEANYPIYSPRSVITSIRKQRFGNYWSQTETYEALKIYIDRNIEGLKDCIIALLAGEQVKINVDTFVNDMTTMNGKDDVLTLLVHLGYLGYDSMKKTVYIPNKEVRSSFIAATTSKHYEKVNKILMHSEDLLKATWNMDYEAVAKYVEFAHLETSILQYNHENALSYTLSLAYFTARDEYTIIRELPTGKGFADLVFLPFTDKPAMIVALKWNQDAETAIQQIKEKKYTFGLEKYQGNLLLVGINYDKTTKKHTCTIEKY